MKVVRIKAGQTMKLRKVVKKVFADKKLSGAHARTAKKYFGEVIINSLK
jgi:hypothetical protein